MMARFRPRSSMHGQVFSAYSPLETAGTLWRTPTELVACIETCPGKATVRSGQNSDSAASDLRASDERDRH